MQGESHEPDFAARFPGNGYRRGGLKAQDAQHPVFRVESGPGGESFTVTDNKGTVTSTG
jgi:hypothetical protein